jgi:hypothetical protein
LLKKLSDLMIRVLVFLRVSHNLLWTNL